MSRRLHRLFLDGPAGRLEALLEDPGPPGPTHAALVCHPHPQHGGTMLNKVVYRLARAFRKSGAAVLRFNYRGVHLSEGVYDEGRGEAEDARAALAWLRERYPALPYSLAGFSFGARVAVRLASQLAEPPTRLILAGYPTTYARHELLVRLPVPRVFVHSTNDEHGPRADLEALYHRLWGPKQLHWIEARDHFFDGALNQFEQTVFHLLHT